MVLGFICRDWGCSPAGRQETGDELADPVHEPVAGPCRRRKGRGQERAQRLRIQSELKATLLRHRDLFRVAANPAAAGLDPAAVQAIQGARDRYVAVLQGMLQQGIDQGYLRRFDTALAAAQVLALMDGLLDHERRTGRAVDREHVTDEVSALLSRGLRAARRGRKRDL